MATMLRGQWSTTSQEGNLLVEHLLCTGLSAKSTSILYISVHISPRKFSEYCLCPVTGRGKDAELQ